jgi:hypothetical protein
MSPDIFFGEGDTAPIVTKTLMVGGVQIDLTGATVTIRYRSKFSALDADTVAETVTIVGDPTAGGIEWHVQAPVVGGEYDFYWHVVLQSGDPITIPNDRKGWMHVEPAL